jgi:hypothetical protein
VLAQPSSDRNRYGRMRRFCFALVVMLNLARMRRALSRSAALLSEIFDPMSFRLLAGFGPSLTPLAQRRQRRLPRQHALHPLLRLLTTITGQLVCGLVARREGWSRWKGTSWML